MRKQLGFFASLMFLSISALTWTGCSNSCNTDCEPCEPICEPCRPICPPAQPVCPPKMKAPCAPEMEKPCPPKPCPPKPCAPAPCPPKPCPPKPCPPKPCEAPCPPKVQAECDPCNNYVPPKCAAQLKECKFGPACECSCNGVRVRAKNPKMCILGEQYPLDVEVSASCDVCDVVLTTTLPEGVTFLRSQPEAKVEGRKLTWNFGGMKRGQTIPGRVWLKCEREGDLCTCFCVDAKPVAFCALLCAKPVLVCEKCGPAQVSPGDPINYVINVTNIGTCTAEDVVVTDTLPDGVESPTGQRTLTFKLGNLEPCQTKRVNFCVTACKRGKICNQAVVQACNANQTSCEFCTCVCACEIDCSKVGPKEVPVGHNADYKITVVNTGDLPLHEVVVTDSAPSATTIVNAPGAQICGKQAVWKLRELKPGEKQEFNITLTTCNPGYFVNTVNVTNCEACNGCCEFGTNWKGRPAIETCMTVSENPICVGETTRYKVELQNVGQEYDTNVKVVVKFPGELAIVDSSGATAGRVDGQSVVFEPFPNLAPRQNLEYYVTVKANASGDLRPKVEISSDFIKNPITSEESLIVN